MGIAIKDIRRKTGLTQKAFAEMYGIPLSTLRKWEQGESSPPAYVVDLIARTLPAADGSLRTISGRKGAAYYYDPELKQVSDSKGNTVRIREDIDGVKERNLSLYLDELFGSFYDIQEKFDRDCRYDRQEDFIWL